MAKHVDVQVQGDHLEKLASCGASVALAELIWNGLDADASKVEVRFLRNSMEGVSEIVVEDDGVGVQREGETPETLFGKLGGSWKKAPGRRRGRALHGRAGVGRFRAFSLGSAIQWETRYLDQGQVHSYTVKGVRKVPRFEFSDPTPSTQSRGTRVTIYQLNEGLSLSTPSLVEKLTQVLALYLQQYTNVRVIVDGVEIDPASCQTQRQDLDRIVVKVGDREVEAELTVVEWNNLKVRSLHLCDGDGFSLAEEKPGIQAPGFTFTAYLRSNYFKELFEQNMLEGELFTEKGPIVEEAKKRLRDHFRRRTADLARGAVERWRDEKVYPYDGVAQSPIEDVERQVFDICALNMSQYIPDFERSDPKQKKLAFRLVREAIERNPGSLQTILSEVLQLPKEKQDELAALLKQTTLSALINVSKLVTDRLNFLRGLEDILLEPESKKKLLERSQLHKILAQNTWIFGEEYNLTVNDESLTTALKRHTEQQGRVFEDDEPPVLRDDGTEGILDLMLTRLLLQPNPQKREHLVVELKRPKQSVDSGVLDQVKKYAFAVIEDDRFRDTETVWRFIAISNELSRSVRREANQKGRARGLVYEDSDARVTIWVLAWRDILDEARGRLEFFRKALDHNATTDTGREYLQATHAKYLPKPGAEAGDPGGTADDDADDALGLGGDESQGYGC